MGAISYRTCYSPETRGSNVRVFADLKRSITDDAYIFHVHPTVVWVRENDR
jgi:hypothetical protein